MEPYHDKDIPDVDLGPPSQPTVATPRLPPEILLQIINWLHPGESYFHSRWQNFPWSYTYVCQYWRRVLIATPRLWTIINVGNGSRNRSEQQHLHEHARVTLQIERAGTQPLLILTNRASNFDTKVLELLARHHDRWSKARLDLSIEDLQRLLRTRQSWSFDELRYSVIRLHDPDSIFLPNHDAFMHAPQLTKLRLRHLDTKLMPLNKLNFPWSQLTHLLLTPVYAKMDHIREVLGQCTMLRELDLDVEIDDEDGWAPSNGPITLPHLDSLTYDASPMDGELLRFLHLPALEDLILGSGTPIQQIKSCLISSKPPLIAIDFSAPFLPENGMVVADAIADILEMAPSLEYLGIELGHQSELELESIMTLLDFTGEHKLCPYLNSLALKEAPLSHSNSGLFMKMLASRSLVTLNDNMAVFEAMEDLISPLGDDSLDSEEAFAILAKVKYMQQNDVKMLTGLKNVLHEFTVTFSENKTKEDCFSEDQLSRIDKLTARMDFTM